jgi:LPXTG-motif cell wall-anchored protein
VPEEFDGPVLAKFESTDDFDVDIDDVQDFESYPCDSECPPYVGYSMWDLAPGEYFIEIEDNSETVSWVSNVEIFASPQSFGDLPFSYTSNGEKTMYSLVVEESQTVTLFATAGQTCLPSDDDEEGDGFVDSELKILGPNGVDESDDNSGRGAGNCSASLIEIELEPGTYSVYVEDDDQEGGSITLGSSIELAEGSITWDLASASASPDTTFEIVVPAGGAWFRANTVTNETVTWIYDMTDPEDSVLLSEEGCVNPDGDLQTPDYDCFSSFLVLLDDNGEEVVSDAYGGEQYSWSTSNGIETGVLTNYGASDFSLFLEEGVYTLAVMECCGPWENEEPSTDIFEVRFGFGSFGAAEIPQVEVLADTNPTIPASVKLVNLPDAQLRVDGSVSTSISDGVNTMVCDTSCIDALFTSAGIADGTITITAGGDTVTMRKGQKKAMIPIGVNTDAINATVVSADGSQTVNLSSKISQIPASVQSAFESKTATGSTGSGSSMNWLLIAALGLIVIAGAGVAVSRKKKSA